MSKQVVPIYNRWIAVALSDKYNMQVLKLQRNNKNPNGIVYFFEKTDELVKVMKKDYDINIA